MPIRKILNSLSSFEKKIYFSKQTVNGITRMLRGIYLLFRRW